MTISTSPEEESRVPQYNRRNVFFFAGCAYTLFLNAGMIMGWASPALPKLKEEKHNFTNSQFALLGSINGLAPGPLLTIFGIDSIGRKWTLLLIWSTTVIGLGIMLCTTDIHALLVARFIAGIGMGASFSCVSVYIAEISDVGVRSALNSLSLIFISLGKVVDYSVGPFVSFFSFILISLIISAVFGILWLFLPESPYFQIGNGKTDDARSTLKRLRIGASADDIEEELVKIQFCIEEERRGKSGFKKLFTSRVVWKQFAISFYLLYLQQGAGLNVLGSYMQEIFDNSHLDIKGSYVSIAVAGAMIFVLIPLPFILKKFGTRLLFMLGGFGSSTFMVLLGIYFLFLNGGYDMSSVRYLSIVCILSIMMSAYAGLGGSVWGMVSELFAPSVKGAATGICGIFSTFMGFLFTEMFGELKGHFGLGATFLGFGLLQLVATFGIFMVIDTSKMTLQEIQDYFEGRSSPKEKKNLNL